MLFHLSKSWDVHRASSSHPYSLVKRKVVLEQFREGLKLLEVLPQKLSKKLFVSVNENDATDFLDTISFVNLNGNNHLVTYFPSSEYILSTQPIRGGFYFGESFFVSTFSFKLDCPNAFASFKNLKMLMKLLSIQVSM